MAKGSRLRFRLSVVLTTLLIAAAVRAEAGEGTAPPEIIPPKRATRFLIRNVAPDYPIIAKMNYIQGRVSVQTLVDPGGEVTEAHVVKGHPFLAMAALKAIRNWLFKPAHNRKGPPRFLTYVEVQFSLQSRRFGRFPAKPENDLNRQIQPPELLENVLSNENGKTVRMRVLVGPDGKVLDSVPLAATADDLREARRNLANLSFRPAYWGALAVPWYLEVDVPVETWPTVQSLAQPGGQ